MWRDLSTKHGLTENGLTENTVEADFVAAA